MFASGKTTAARWLLLGIVSAWCLPAPGEPQPRRQQIAESTVRSARPDGHAREIKADPQVVNGDVAFLFNEEALTESGYRVVSTGMGPGEAHHFVLSSTPDSLVQFDDGRAVSARFSISGALLLIHDNSRVALRNPIVRWSDGHEQAEGSAVLVDGVDPPSGTCLHVLSPLLEVNLVTGRYRFTGRIVAGVTCNDVVPDSIAPIGTIEIQGGFMETPGTPNVPQSCVGDECPEEGRDKLSVDAAEARASDGSTGTGEGSGGVAFGGPDLIVSSLLSVINYGVVGGVAALSVGTTSCNIGTQAAVWEADTNQHPVIALNMYRLKDDRFQQIGMSWLKHGFFATNGAACFPDCIGAGGSRLGVHCSDPYSASLNGSQPNLGPRYQVNATTGVFPFPPANPSYSGITARRLQVATVDLDQILNADAEYFFEAHYVSPDDAAAGNGLNNASYRSATVAGAGTAVWTAMSGPTYQGLPAIRAWARLDPSVVETDVHVPGDGLFVVAAKSRQEEFGIYSYEYAVFNLNSHRSAESFRVPIDPSTVVRNDQFHDVHYHSGEPFIGADWQVTTTPVSITWSTQSYDVNPDANALRWSTLYNYRFETTAPPQMTTATLGLFRPGTPESVDFTTIGPVTNAADCNGNEVPDSIDIAEGFSDDCDGDNIPDECEGFAIQAVRVADGLNRPILIVAPPGDDSRLLIVEQGGRIRVLANGILLPAPFLDISPLVSNGNEQGLLGMAFDPQYGANGSFYLSYVDIAGDTVIARYRVSVDPDVADASSAVVLKRIVQDGGTHNGGHLEFAPDGTLYVGIGDGSGTYDPLNRAQDTSTLLGKMIRLDVGNPPDYIPADNPFAAPSLPLDEIWALGLRNPTRFGFDRLTGDLYIADPGADAFHEIDIQPAAGNGGENYGWRCMEGAACTGLTGCVCNSPALALPAWTFGREIADCRVTGGRVYRGCAIPNLLGTYFYADYCSGAIRSFRYVDGSVTDVRDRTLELIPTEGPISHIASFGEDADGELYIVSDDGAVYEIVPRDVPPDVCGNGVVELDEECDDGNTAPLDGCSDVCLIEPAVANDTCPAAAAIAEGTVPFDTTTATTGGAVPPASCGFGANPALYRDVWFCYTASCTGQATISLCGSGFDTRLAVHEGCGCPPVTEPIACDQTDCGSQQNIQVPVEACQTYMLRVGGQPGAFGSGVVNVDCVPDPVVNDCNGNGVEDATDIACGTSTDGNGNGTPDECETVGEPVVGGRLYDRWWAELSLTAPTTEHPLWALRPDTTSNPAIGAATWRCKECHGWDYQGVDGQYGSGSHRTGFPGILGTTLAASELFDLLAKPPSNGGGAGIPNGHDYGSRISDVALNDMVAFILSGAIDTSAHIDGTGTFLGDAALGESNYQSAGTIACMTCHGADGTAIDFGTIEEPEYLGTIARDNPWELLHKIRFSQPAAPMPSWLAEGGTNQGATDIGRYIQLNHPTDCIMDEQCDDGVVCTMDTCDGDGRCVFQADDDACPSDGVFCNGREVCDTVIGCMNAGNPCGDVCSELDGCGCAPPLVEAAGGRYVAITPQSVAPDVRMRLAVTPLCPMGTTSYVEMPSGPYNIAGLVEDPAVAAMLLPEEWGGTVYVTGIEIVPETLYSIRADCGIQPGLAQTLEVVVDTGLWGDVAGETTADGWTPPNGLVQFLDIAAIVDGFKQSSKAPPVYALDLYGCDPDGQIDFIDIFGGVEAFRGRTYPDASLCPGPCW